MAYLRIPGNDGDAFAFPYSATYADTAIIDVRADAALDTWQQGGIAEQNLMAFWGTSTASRSWGLFSYQHSNLLRFWIWNGSSTEILSSTASTGATATERLQVRAVANSTAGTLDFYTRDPTLGLGLSSDTSWSALGTQVAVTTAPFLVPTFGEVTFGANGGSYDQQNVTGGDWYGGYIKTGGSTEVFDVDFADVSTWVYS